MSLVSKWVRFTAGLVTVLGFYVEIRSLASLMSFGGFLSGSMNGFFIVTIYSVVLIFEGMIAAVALAPQAWRQAILG